MAEPELLYPPQTPLVVDAALARNLLWRFVTEEDSRQRFAKKNREAMHAQLETGNATGHRAEWVVASSNALVDALMRTAHEFNGTYPYDIVLLGDFLDVLSTTKARFLRAAGVDVE
jgi:hypothetical protein